MNERPQHHRLVVPAILSGVVPEWDTARSEWVMWHNDKELLRYPAGDKECLEFAFAAVAEILGLDPD